MNEIKVYEKELLLALICEEQIRMLIDNPSTYTNSKYKNLESLKVTVKDLEVLREKGE